MYRLTEELSQGEASLGGRRREDGGDCSEDVRGSVSEGKKGHTLNRPSSLHEEGTPTATLSLIFRWATIAATFGEKKSSAAEEIITKSQSIQTTPPIIVKILAVVSGAHSTYCAHRR